MDGPQNQKKLSPAASPGVDYERWHQLASRLLSRERPNHTLGPTALVHEAWLRTAGQSPAEGLAARAMQHALIDHARARGAARRDAARTESLGEQSNPSQANAALDPFRQAFERLEALDPKLTRLLRLRFEDGLNVEQTAERLEISPRSVKRETRSARAWLRQTLSGENA